MAYEPTLWKDRNVQYPNRYTDESDNVKTFTPSPGIVTEAGTWVTAARMNKIEQGIVKNEEDLAENAQASNAALADKAGRYSQEVGLLDATYVDCGVNGSVVDLDHGLLKRSQNTGADATSKLWTSYVGVGQQFLATYTTDMAAIIGVDFKIQSKLGGPVGTWKLDLYDQTTSTQLGTTSIPMPSGAVGDIVNITFPSPIAVVAGHILQLRLSAPLANASNYVDICMSGTDVLANSEGFYTSDTFASLTVTGDLWYNVYYTPLSNTSVSGTVIKTISPSDIRAWGSAKWAQITPTGSMVVCDVLNASDAVLMSNITSIADLSTLSPTTYPVLKLRWTLTRDLPATATPALAITPSVTWEGKPIVNQSATGHQTFLVSMAANGGTYNKVIPLPFKARKGRLFLEGSGSSPFFGIFSNDSALSWTGICAAGVSGGMGGTPVYGVGGEGSYNGNTYADIFNASSSGKIRITSIALTGSNLVVSFINPDTTYAVSGQPVMIRWEVEAT